MPKTKILLGIGLIFIFACIFVFSAGMFFPRALGFLDGVMCPDGMQLGNHVQQQYDNDGNLLDATSSVCVVEGQPPVDVTPAMLALLFGLAILGGAFIVWSMGGIQRLT
jgi:hypothetical protein